MSTPRNYAADNGFLPLANEAATKRYDDATEAFRVGGSRAALMGDLVALGVAADIVRWHASYPGNRMPVMITDLD